MKHVLKETHPASYNEELTRSSLEHLTGLQRIAYIEDTSSRFLSFQRAKVLYKLQSRSLMRMEGGEQEESYWAGILGFTEMNQIHKDVWNRK